MRWLTIDPGISGTGIAFFEDRKLISWLNITPNARLWKTFYLKTNWIVCNMRFWLKEKDIERIFIEWPTGRFSGSKGLAAQNSDAIIKLAYFIGRIQEKLRQTYGTTALRNGLIPVIKWKGNLPKIVVQRRAEVFFQKKGFKSHAADAVGIGMYCIQENLI